MALDEPLRRRVSGPPASSIPAVTSGRSRIRTRPDRALRQSGRQECRGRGAAARL